MMSSVAQRLGAYRSPSCLSSSQASVPRGVSFALTGAWTKTDVAGLSHTMHLTSTLRLSLEQVWVCDGPSLWADGTLLILC